MRQRHFESVGFLNKAKLLFNLHKKSLGIQHKKTLKRHMIY